MNIRSIASQVAFYLQTSRSQFVDTEGNDFIISALNSARKNAELQHDFINHEAQAWLSVDPVAGGLMTDCKLVTGDTNTATVVRTKAISTAYIQSSITGNTTWWPIWVDPKKLLAMKTKERNYRWKGYPNRYGSNADDPLTRYAGDFSSYYASRPFRGYFLGERFFLDPAPDVATLVRFDVQLWGDEYVPNLVRVVACSTGVNTATVSSGYASNFRTGATFLGRTITTINTSSEPVVVGLTGNADQTITTPTWVSYVNNVVPPNTGENYEDWFTKHGYEFLKWSAIVECNMQARQFVPREVGFLAPPERMRDEALARLIAWDDWQWEQGRQPLAVR